MKKKNKDRTIIIIVFAVIIAVLFYNPSLRSISSSESTATYINNFNGNATMKLTFYPHSPTTPNATNETNGHVILTGAAPNATVQMFLIYGGYPTFTPYIADTSTILLRNDTVNSTGGFNINLATTGLVYFTEPSQNVHSNIVAIPENLLIISNITLNQTTVNTTTISTTSTTSITATTSVTPTTATTTATSTSSSTTSLNTTSTSTSIIASTSPTAPNISPISSAITSVVNDWNVLVAWINSLRL